MKRTNGTTKSPMDWGTFLDELTRADIDAVLVLLDDDRELIVLHLRSLTRKVRLGQSPSRIGVTPNWGPGRLARECPPLRAGLGRSAREPRFPRPKRGRGWFSSSHCMTPDFLILPLALLGQGCYANLVFTRPQGQKARTLRQSPALRGRGTHFAAFTPVRHGRGGRDQERPRAAARYAARLTGRGSYPSRPWAPLPFSREPWATSR